MPNRKNTPQLPAQNLGAYPEIEKQVIPIQEKIFDPDCIPFGAHKGTAYKDLNPQYASYIMAQEWIDDWHGVKAKLQEAFPEFYMPFGLHKGKPLQIVPTDYLNYILLKMESMTPALRDILIAETERRYDDKAIKNCKQPK